MDNDDLHRTPGQGGDEGGETALEARIVAWVLGEASAFEVAELERLVTAQPELALFKRRIEAVHGLLGEAGEVRKADTLSLTPERRTRLLQTLGVPVSAASETAPAAVESARAKKSRRFSPEWKALRLYFGTAAACVLVFLVVQQVSVVHFSRPADRRAHVTMMELTSNSALEEERQERFQAVMSATGQLHERKAESEKKSAEFEAELARRQVELVREAVELRELSRENAESMDLPAVANDWSFSTSAGAVTIPVTRNIGTGRIGPLYGSASAVGAADDGGEPETVPAGDDDQRITLDEFKVTATAESAGYHATSTLAGTRLNTTLRDVGSAVSVASAATFSDSANDERPASSYKFKQEGGDVRGDSTPASGQPAEFTWSAGFGAETPRVQDEIRRRTTEADSAPVSVRTQQLLRDTGATNNESLLQYATATEAGGVAGNVASSQPDARAARAVGDGYLADRDVRVRMQRMENEIARRRAQRSDGVALDGTDKKDAIAAPPAAPAAKPEARPKPAPPMSPDQPAVRAKAPIVVPAAIDEAHAAKEPVSTFSLHVSDASFKLAQAAFGRGQLPDPATIRPEEFYNAFDYGDPSPTVGQKVACRIEQAAHPFLQQRNLVRVAMKVANTGRSAGQPLRLTVLLDTSGSMEREDRVASVRRAMEVLASLLGPNDRVTLIGFARQPRLLAEAMRGDEAKRLVDLVARTPADGGTNMEEALKLADQLAQRHFEAAAQNRIVLLTDGAANLGNADPAQLATRIEALRGRGIAFDACGVGTDGLDDEILEALTRRGDGRYYVLDAPADADAGFARQLAGAFRPAAKNVKVQVRFNPARVGAYRLLGFEKHRLREQDFRNDRVDAAELAAEEAAVAVYQVEVLPQGEGDLGDVFVRFRDMASGEMVERSWTIAHDNRVRAFDQASPALQLAGTAALLAEVLRGGALGDQVDLGALAPVVNRLKGHYAQQPRVQELVAMFEQLRRKLNR